MGRQLIENFLRVNVWDLFKGESQSYKETMVRVYDFVILTTEYKEKKYIQRVRLTLTPCNFSGIRLWFLCPKCNRRVGTLYWNIYDIRLLCRHCRNLTYECSNRHKTFDYENIGKPLKKMKGIESKMQKKGIRCDTWFKLLKKHEQCTEVFKNGLLTIDKRSLKEYQRIFKKLRI